MIFLDLVLRFIDAGYVTERDLVLDSLSNRARLLPKLMAFPPPACSWRMNR